MDIKQLLNKDIGGLPAWVWGIAGLGGIGLGYYFYSRAKSGSSTSTTDTTTPVSPAIPDIGTPVGPSAGNQQPTGATINIGVPATPTNWLTSIILANHPVNEYASAGTPGGLPDAVIGTIPANSTVQATGPEVVGAWNIPNGSELWYPVTYNGIPGFVSAYDVVNSSTTIGTTPVTPPPTTAATNHIRQSTNKGYDASHPGVPTYTDVNKPSDGIAIWGDAVTVLQTGIKGPNHSNKGIYDKTTYKGVTTFIASQDIV